MKRSVSASVLVAIAFGNMTAAYAGFEVIPSYEYTGAKPPVIQSTQALQNARPDNNIFIDEPNYTQPRGYASPSSQTRMLQSSRAAVNNSINNKASLSTMSDVEIQSLVKSLNHITFVGKPPSTVSMIYSSGKSSNLKGGMQKIIPSEYSILLYPSVQKKYAKKSVTWNGGERWLIALDKVLDNNKLKAVVVWSDLKVYVSEEKENISPYVEPQKNLHKSDTYKVANNNIIAPQSFTKSPFSDDSKKTLISTTASASTKNAVETVPAIVYKPVTLTSWTAKSGIMLSAMVSEWATKQGWTLIWRSEKDYNIVTPFTVTSLDKTEAGFLEAMKKVFALYDRAQYPFKVDAYPDQKLMFVTTKGDNKG